MKKFFLLSLLLTVFFCMINCDESEEADDGIVTISLTGDTISTAHGLHAYLYQSGETDLYNSAAVLACNYHQVLGGTISFTLKTDDGNWEPTADDWSGNGGDSYDIYIYTADDSGTPDGSDYSTNPMPMEITIDGDMTINIEFSDMIPYVDP